ncbi:phage minor head protein [uncultured Rhodospira sp.]|uniref:phage head morphogenesis protein n=1 Tax=uncultured Rhodospira sp. TaxID=1936189 RepID=UPI00261672B7|nr:phage minor head protein [uncultured Rhodospira sp.]
MPEVSPFGVQPEEALAALATRGRRLDPSFAWQDVWQDEHGKAFTVAKSTGFDILGDIHASLTEALQNGETFESWRQRLTPILRAKGWWGREDVTDPATGKVVTAQLGSPRRLRTIYDVNMRVSRAAGHWAQIERAAERERSRGRTLYLRYVAVRDERTRRSHRHWHGTVLPHDHTWWDTHTPPNGWRCRCSPLALTERDLRRYGYTPDEGPPSEPEPDRLYRNPRTGEVTRVPPGIDPGWAHNPGRTQHTATQAVARLASLPPDLAAVAPLVNPRLTPALVREFGQWVGDIERQILDGQPRPKGVARAVGLLPPGVVASLPVVVGEGVSSATIMVADRQIIHMLRDAKADAVTAEGLPKAWPVEEVMRLPEILAAPEAIYWDRQTKSLIYTVPAADGRAEKLVVRVNYVLRHRDEAGRRVETETNTVISTGYERAVALATSRRFTRLR